MVYRKTSAQDVTSQPATLSAHLSRPPFSPSPIVIHDEKALSSLTVTRRPKLSPALSTHYIHNAGGTVRADAFETNAFCLFVLSGWFADCLEGYI